MSHGTVSYHAPDPERVPCPHRGKAMAYYTCPDCGEQFPAHRDKASLFSDANLHPDAGRRFDWRLVEQAPGVRVFLRGYTAQGAAGRMGGGPELLAVMEPGARIVARRSGRLYGAPATLLVEHERAAG